MKKLAHICLGIVVALALSQCGDASDGAMWNERPGYDTSDRNGNGPGWGAEDVAMPPGEDGDEAPEPAPPPLEREEEFAPPSVGDRFVFVLNESREQVVLIDGVRLDIRLVEVGLSPKLLATAPGHDVAVVLNRGGANATILHANPDHVTTRTVPTLPAVNRLAMAPDGRHAVAYFAYAAAAAGDPVGSLQAVTVLRLVPDQEAAVAVGTGFNPQAVHFTDDGQTLFVVTDQGLTRIPLTGRLEDLGVRPTIPLFEDPLAAGLPRAVVVSPDGAFALSLTEGQEVLTVVDLDQGRLTEIPLPAAPTDIDLSPDGDTLLIMLGGAEQALLASLRGLMAGDAEDEWRVVELGAAYGAAIFTPDGDEALLYSTVAGLKSLLRLDVVAALTADPAEPLPAGLLRPILLQKTVRAVAFAPDGARALVLHRPSGRRPNANMSLDEFVTASPAYSVVDMASAFATIALTESEPGAFTFTPGAERLYVLLPDAAGAAHKVADVYLQTLMVETRPLPSRPEAIQPVPAAMKVAVTQEHPSGRITLFDVASGAAETLTGFQLGGLID
jgi:DNA-binding beta-propeller fold protein YncE